MEDNCDETTPETVSLVPPSPLPLLEVIAHLLMTINLLKQVREEIVGQKQICSLLIDRCLSLEHSLPSLTLTSPVPPDTLQDLEDLQKLLLECHRICKMFTGRGWIRSAYDILWSFPALFDTLNLDLTNLSTALQLEISIAPRNPTFDLPQIIFSLNHFLDVMGPGLNSVQLPDMMKLSLEFSGATQNPETLDLLHLRYEATPEQTLGTGGFGSVYRGRYGRDEVAVKVITDINEKEKLSREVRVMRNAQHPNVIKLFGYSLEKSLIVMEIANCCLVDVLSSNTFSRSISQTYLQSMPDVLRCFIDILSGLRYLHYHKILHRDLKPHNILIVLNNSTQSPIAKISDFGLATLSSLSLSIPIVESSRFGSMAYLAPELLQTQPIYSEKSDMYAIGIVFNEVLTRRHPYPDLCPDRIMSLVKAGNRPIPKWDEMFVFDQGLSSIIESCLVCEAKNRPSADYFLNTLQSSLAPTSNLVLQMVYDQVVVIESQSEVTGYLDVLATAGYAPAQNSLGVSAIKEGNFADAFKYFSLAAEQSYHPAEFNLGCCYEEGKGTEEGTWAEETKGAEDGTKANQNAALSYFRRCAEASFPPALYKLGLFHESIDELERASKLYQSGAELNHAPCQFKFGFLHELLNDYSTASQYYLLASNQNYPPAQHHLALLYLQEKATPPSSTSSVDAAKALLLLSASRNYPPSHFILATELNSFAHLDAAVALRYDIALIKRNKPLDGLEWTEKNCSEINQPDFPFLVPPVTVTQVPLESDPDPDHEEAGSQRSIEDVEQVEMRPAGYIVIPPEGPWSKTPESYRYFFHHLVLCLALCVTSFVLLSLIEVRKWDESSSGRRTLSSFWDIDANLSTVNNQVQPDVHSSHFMFSNHSTQRSLSSIIWPSYFAVPGETVLKLCPGHTLDVSMCSTSLDSNIACSGDPLLELLNFAGTYVVTSNDDFCDFCPSLLYTVPSSSTCSNYRLKASCYDSVNCSGKALVTITTSTCSEAFAGVLSSSTNSYPLLSCSLLWLNRNSLSNLEGSWTMLNGGSMRDQCQLLGSGYAGSSYSSSWSSTATNRRFYFCTNEEDKSAVSFVAGGGSGSDALFSAPSGVTVSFDDSYALIADSYHNTIRKIIISTAVVSVVAGGGPTSRGSSNGIGSNALFDAPFGVSLSPDARFALVADSGNCLLRKIVLSTSQVSFLAGGEGYGYSNGVGSNALFDDPRDIVVSSNGRFALVADMYNHVIRKLVILTSTVSLVAGREDRSSGTSNGIGSNALFNYPRGVSLSSDGSYALVADTDNHMIRKIIMTTAEVSLVAGGGSGSRNGIGSNALFNYPSGISISSDGSSALVADTDNHMVRMIELSTSEVSLLVGGVNGYRNGIGSSAWFNWPSGLGLSSDGSFALVAEYENNMIRKIDISPISTVSTPSSSPTFVPSVSPSTTPSSSPTTVPTVSPSSSPSTQPTVTPSTSPTTSPTFAPTTLPSVSPSTLPTTAPSSSPTTVPTVSPSSSPSTQPTVTPSTSPTTSPTFAPTNLPSISPTSAPSPLPTTMPSVQPTILPTVTPTAPTASPTLLPSTSPTTVPSVSPSVNPSVFPTNAPSGSPTISPSVSPTNLPSVSPTSVPSTSPTSIPTGTPTSPTSIPSSLPTGSPTFPFISDSLYHTLLDRSSSYTPLFALLSIFLALILVLCRLLIILLLSPSCLMKFFTHWWWVGYLLCSGISTFCAGAIVVTDLQTEETQDPYLTSFYLYLGSTVISLCALLLTPELFIWMLPLDRRYFHEVNLQHPIQ